MAPASMSKLMTVYMLMEALKEGRVSLDSMFSVSENAWSKGGAASGSSTMFLKPREQVKVQDLLRGIIVHRITSYNVCYTKLLRSSTLTITITDSGDVISATVEDDADEFTASVIGDATAATAYSPVFSTGEETTTNIRNNFV